MAYMIVIFQVRWMYKKNGKIILPSIIVIVVTILLFIGKKLINALVEHMYVCNSNSNNNNDRLKICRLKSRNRFKPVYS